MAERKLSGVRVSLPRLTRVRAVSHDAYSGATLTYDDERRDYELCKLESVPGVREDDPLNGAKVALPPQNYTWDPEQLLWVHSRSKQPYAEMVDGPSLDRMKIKRGTRRPRRSGAGAWRGRGATRHRRCGGPRSLLIVVKVMIWARWARGP